MISLKTTLAAALVLGSATFAYAYASNPAVQARQEAMQTFGGNLKKLMPMVQGAAPYDAAVATAAFAEISATVDMVPGLFEAHEKDPESKASDKIWDNWDDFTAKAAALKTAAAADVSTPEALAAAMGPLGGTCKACHMAYQTE